MGEEREPIKTPVNRQFVVLVTLCAAGALLALYDLAGTSIALFIDGYFGGGRSVRMGGRSLEFPIAILLLLFLPLAKTVLAFPGLLMVMRRRRAGGWLFAGALLVIIAEGLIHGYATSRPPHLEWQVPVAAALLVAALPLLLSARTWRTGGAGRVTQSDD